MKKTLLYFTLLATLFFLAACSPKYDGKISGPAKTLAVEVTDSAEGYLAGVVRLESARSIIDKEYEDVQAMDPKDVYDGDPLKLTEAEQFGLQAKLMSLQIRIHAVMSDFSTIEYSENFGKMEDVRDAEKRISEYIDQIKELLGD